VPWRGDAMTLGYLRTATKAPLNTVPISPAGVNKQQGTKSGDWPGRSGVHKCREGLLAAVRTYQVKVTVQCIKYSFLCFLPDRPVGLLFKHGARRMWVY
jgi:hypothetical protein